MNTKRILISFFICLFAFLAGSLDFSASASEETAENIAKSCTYTFSSNSSRKPRLIDNNLTTLYTCEKSGSQYIEIDFNDNQVQGIYLKWRKPCFNWNLYIDMGDGFGNPIPRGQYGYVQEYIELESGVKRIKLSTDDASLYPLEILDLFIYSNGTLPSSVHKWNPTPSNAELMVVSTHQDDEILFFGGTIPYYSNELGLDTVVVYTAFENGLRLHESLEGLWACGYKQNPIFLCLPDKYCTTLEKAERYWDRGSVSKTLTELILIHKPQVIVTHDENGEYGHGQHILTVECIKDAIENAADSTYVKEHFPTREAYNVPKCYLHLYSKNKVVLPWDKLTISSQNGKTSLAVAQAAFKKHTSQWSTGFRVRMSGRNNCSKFGLYHTTVGKDTLCNDFFENITLRITDIEISDSDLPTDFLVAPNYSNLYIYTNPITEEQQYVRYGTVSDSDGWYCADETGAILLPTISLNYFEDVSCSDLDTYETISNSDISPMIYVYKSDLSLDAQYIRYGNYNNECGWFYVDETGNPTFDKSVELTKSYPVISPTIIDKPQPNDIPDASPDFIPYIVGIISILVVCIILFIFIKKRQKNDQ